MSQIGRCHQSSVRGEGKETTKTRSIIVLFVGEFQSSLPPLSVLFNLFLKAKREGRKGVKKINNLETKVPRYHKFTSNKIQKYYTKCTYISPSSDLLLFFPIF